MRLIDADALIELLHKNTNIGFYGEFTDGSEVAYTQREVVKIIDEQPAAFDADMVYRQMWREAEEVCGNTMIDLEVADEIIRNGGKE